MRKPRRPPVKANDSILPADRPPDGYVFFRDVMAYAASAGHADITLLDFTEAQGSDYVAFWFGSRPAEGDTPPALIDELRKEREAAREKYRKMRGWWADEQHKTWRLEREILELQALIEDAERTAP